MPDKLYYDGKCFSRKNLSVSFFKEPLSHVPLCLSALPSIPPFALLTWTSLTMLSYMSMKLGHWIQQPIQQLHYLNFHEFFLSCLFLVGICSVGIGCSIQSVRCWIINHQNILDHWYLTRYFMLKKIGYFCGNWNFVGCRLLLWLEFRPMYLK